MKDYNGIEIPKKVKAEKVIITVNVLYNGKYGSEEPYEIENCNLEDWPGMDEAVSQFEIEYDDIFLEGGE
tara:strand:+ start:153 stop:362 length:210 start_codon:yes stop_codon:yes gene_type:complete